MFWTAPENLRRVLRGERRQYTQPADIYSVAVVLKEILCKNTAYEEEMHMLNMTPRGQLVTQWLLSIAEAKSKHVKGSKESYLLGQNTTCTCSV